MQLAYGDFQVSMYAGAAEARTIGASAVEPALDPVARGTSNLFYGIPAVQHYPFAGSAVEIWDSGPGRVQPPPVGNVPPTARPTTTIRMRIRARHAAAQTQISDFLQPNGQRGQRVRRRTLPLVRLHALRTDSADPQGLTGSDR